MIIRPATEHDQAAITAIIRAARINPSGLDWRRFLVVDDAGRIIGTGQIKPHDDGTYELSSLAVVPDRQRGGLASAIVYALLARSHGRLYLTCEQHMWPFYARFGFRSAAPAEMTPYLWRTTHLLNIFLFVSRQPERLTVMVRR